MNAKQKINSLIQLEEGESVAKTYNTVPSKDHSFKKIFLPSFLITTAIFFLSFLYIAKLESKLTKQVLVSSNRT